MTPAPRKTFADHIAFVIGTGFGSGLLRPAPGTWGSIVGFAYFAALMRIPSCVLIFAIAIALFLAGIWSAGKCEAFFGEKDPGSVVIDEIACVPFALWPFYFTENRDAWWLWLAVFIVYRILDIVKIFPGRRLEKLGGGAGIMFDDLLSSLYTAALFFAAIKLRLV